MPVYTNLNMRPSNAPLDATFSPRPGARSEFWDLNENGSPSLKDAVFQGKYEERERLIDARLANEEITVRGAKRLKNQKLTVQLHTAEEVAVATDKVARLALSQTALKDRLEGRISAFLLQLIDCYDTDYHFTIGKTETQTTSTPEIRFNLPAGIALPARGQRNMEMAATHQGTVPCIFAYKRRDWEQWKARANGNPRAAGKPAPIVYHKMADPYLANNACVGLDKTINDPADISLDGNPQEKHIEFGRAKPENQKKLREISIGILNRVARKELTPVEGFVLYMAKLRERVETLVDTVPSEEEKAVFQAWKNHLDTLHAQFRGNFNPLIARLVGVHIPRADRDAINLDVIVFPRHFKHLQRKYLYQSHLAAKVDKLRAEIEALSARTRKKVDVALKVELLRHVEEGDAQVRRMFQRLFNCSGANRDRLEQETYNPALQLVRSDAAQQKITRFVRDFTTHVRDMGIEESQFRSNLLKEIRLVRGYSLRAFATRFNQLHPHAPRRLNYEQLRRTELGCVNVDPAQARRFAAVLEIPDHLLLPGLLT